MSVTGIDVSHHQGVIAWPLVAQAGHRFAFLKATEGTSFVDRRYRANLAAATDVGLLVGAYHFARPDSTDPVRAAEHHLRFAGTDLTGRLPHVLDLEDGHGDLTGWSLAWLDHVEQATGRPPILYTYAAFGPGHLKNDRRLARHPLWLAAYRLDPPAALAAWRAVGWSFWQHTSSGRVPGIGGGRANVDLNRFAGDDAALEALAGSPTTTPPAAPQEDDDVDARTFRWPDGSVAVTDIDGGVRCYGMPFRGSVPMLEPEQRQGFAEAGGAGALRPVNPKDPAAGYIVERRDGAAPFKFDPDFARTLGL